MMALRSIPLFALALSGCASLLAPEPRATSYLCDDGKGFRLVTAGEATVIEIDGMSFRLDPEKAAAGEVNFSCGMLRVSTRGGFARVDMDGRTHREHCREIP